MLITGSGVFHQGVRRRVISEYGVGVRVHNTDCFLRNNKQMELAARVLRAAQRPAGLEPPPLLAEVGHV